MLTVEHVKVRRRKGTAEVVSLCGLDDARALELAGFAVDVVKAHEGEPRQALEEALDELPLVGLVGDGSPDEVRFCRGLKKLALDACDFDVDAGLPPEELRAEVFLAAARARAHGSFSRDDVLAGIAQHRETTVAAVERALYADLGAAHAVKGFDIHDGHEMLRRYRIGELQAVVLRATRLVVDVEGSPSDIRAVLRALKLHQLLFEVEPTESGLRLVVEGPMGLFQQSMKYGLKLAIVLPAILRCAASAAGAGADGAGARGRARVEATVRLRKQGPAETLVIDGARYPGVVDAAETPVPDVVRDLLADLEAAGAPWRPRMATDLLRLPGVGAVVPDLELVHDDTGEVVAVEVLGFWSRAAVWKRVELVEKGLPVRVVFCASERLRVSEEALPPESGAALVVFKGALRAARVREAADRVVRRSDG